MTVDEIAREALPEKVDTTWGEAQYIGVYHGEEENFYVYRLEEKQGTCQFVEFPEKQMRMLIYGNDE